MKIIPSLSLFALLLLACNNKKSEETAPVSTAITTDTIQSKNNTDALS